MTDDPRDAEIAGLKKQVASLTAALEKERGIVAGRQPLALLRDQNRNVNLGKHDGKAPDGYRLLNSPQVSAALRQLENEKRPVPNAAAVRYLPRGKGRYLTFETESKGYIVPQEFAAEVAALAQKMEGRP